MSFESTFAKLNVWATALEASATAANARFTDGVTLSSPRPKDIVVTLPGEDVTLPEQNPALIVRLFALRPDGPRNVQNFKGSIQGKLFLRDEADSVAKLKTKAVRWIDVITAHYSHPASFLDSFGRVVMNDITVTFGTDNVFEIQSAFVLTVTF